MLLNKQLIDTVIQRSFSQIFQRVVLALPGRCNSILNDGAARVCLDHLSKWEINLDL